MIIIKEDKILERLSLYKNITDDALSLDVHSSVKRQVKGSVDWDVPCEKSYRVTISCSVDLFKGKRIDKGIHVVNRFGQRGILMFVVRSGSVYCATLVKVTNFRDDDYIKEHNVLNIEDILNTDGKTYDATCCGTVITINEKDAPYESVPFLEKVDVPLSMKLSDFVRSFSLSMEFFFEHINFNEMKGIGKIHNLVSRFIARKQSAPYPLMLGNRTMRDFYTGSSSFIYHWDFSGKGYPYYFDSQLFEMDDILYSPTVNDTLSLTMTKDVIGVPEECGTERDDDSDSFRRRYYFNQVSDVVFSYDADLRHNFMTDFYFDNLEHFLSDINGRYSIKTHEIFFGKEEMYINQFLLNGDFYYKPDAISLNFKTSGGGDFYDHIRSSCIPFKVGFSLYDNNATEFCSRIVTPLLFCDSEASGKVGDRRLIFNMNLDFTLFSKDSVISRSDYNKTKYCSFFFMFDDNFSATTYDIDFLNVRTMDTFKISIGGMNICSPSRDRRYFVGNRWVSWVGSTIFVDHLMGDFFVRRDIRDLNHYRKLIKLSTSYIHMLMVQGIDRVKRFQNILVFDPSIHKNLVLEGDVYYHQMKINSCEYPNGFGYLTLKYDG